MFQFHVVLDQPKNWLDYSPSWITALAALITVFVAIKIAGNQNRLQKTIAERQIDIQARQLLKDLFDWRFAVFTEVENFIAYVLQSNGKVHLPGPEYIRWRAAMQKAQMLFGADVYEYLVKVDKTARDLYVSALRLDKAIEQGNTEAIEVNHQLLNELSDTLLGQRVQVFRPYLELFHKG